MFALCWFAGLGSLVFWVVWRRFGAFGGVGLVVVWGWGLLGLGFSGVVWVGSLRGVFVVLLGCCIFG